MNSGDNHVKISSVSRTSTRAIGFLNRFFLAMNKSVGYKAGFIMAMVGSLVGFGGLLTISFLHYAKGHLVLSIIFANFAMCMWLASFGFCWVYGINTRLDNIARELKQHQAGDPSQRDVANAGGGKAGT